MNNNNLPTIHQNSKLILAKSKSLIDITQKILAQKDKNNLVKHFEFQPFLMEHGHSNDVQCVAITPDGKHIVSGSWDDTLKIWDLLSGKCIYTLDRTYETGIDKGGYFQASDEAIENYIRVSEAPLTQRKLTPEEIQHFRKKSNEGWL